MKAFVCPQCGGLIDKITEKQTITECDYCGAKIFVQQPEKPEKPKEQPVKKDNLHIPLAGYKPFDEPEVPDTYTGQEAATSTLSALGGIFAAFIIVVTIVGVVVVATKSKKGKGTPTPTPYVYTRETPIQQRVVQSYTNKDALSLPQPVIPPNMFFKTEFDVEAYVSIDEKGNVFEASTNQTQIPQIDRIVIAAAKKAKFPPSATNQRTSATLHYVLGPKTK